MTEGETFPNRRNCTSPCPISVKIEQMPLVQRQHFCECHSQQDETGRQGRGPWSTDLFFQKLLGCASIQVLFLSDYIWLTNISLSIWWTGERKDTKVPCLYSSEMSLPSRSRHQAKEWLSQALCQLAWISRLLGIQESNLFSSPHNTSKSLPCIGLNRNALSSWNIEQEGSKQFLKKAGY